MFQVKIDGSASWKGYVMGLLQNTDDHETHIKEMIPVCDPFLLKKLV